MADKLLVEIDLHNGSADDAIRALVYLANELVECPTIEISTPARWNERSNNTYQVKWRYAEDELHLPLDVDFICQLSDELKMLKRNIPENHLSAIATLQDQLENCLAGTYASLFTETD